MGLAASRQEAFWESCGFGNVERARHFLEEGDIDVNWVSYTVCIIIPVKITLHKCISH